MPTIRTGYWIRVKGGQVMDVWDYAPDPNRMATEAGWKEAIEIFPDLVPNREIITSHSFNLNSEPLEIIWSKRELTVEERRESLINQAKQMFNRTVQDQLYLQMNENPDDQYDANVVAQAKLNMDSRIATIKNTVTHEDLDALM